MCTSCDPGHGFPAELAGHFGRTGLCSRNGGNGEVSASSVVMLPYAPSSVAVARQRLSADLSNAGLLASAVDDVVLIMSELLSNALRHAHPLPSGQLKVAWLCSDTQVEVAVSDGGACTEPRAGRPTLSSLGGRGLGIVEYLAERWGSGTTRRRPPSGPSSPPHGPPETDITRCPKHPYCAKSSETPPPTTPSVTPRVTDLPPSPPPLRLAPVATTGPGRLRRASRPLLPAVTAALRTCRRGVPPGIVLGSRRYAAIPSAGRPRRRPRPSRACMRRHGSRREHSSSPA